VRRTRHLLTVLLACACLPASAPASETVRLHATLKPERLGHGTTLGFGFQIAAPGGQVPPALTEFDLRYPGNLGIALSGIGLDTCSAAALEAFGPVGCPADSFMGFGSGMAEVAFGPEIIREAVELTVVRAATQQGHIALLFHAQGVSPVYADVVFGGLLLGAPAPFGGRVKISVPLVASLPGAPDVAVVKLSSTIGPEHLTYYERVHGRLVAYNPQGILLPNSCPRGGFPFAATLVFQDNSRASAYTTVPCPRSRPRRRL
jgi:hypothetical protein